MYSSFEPVVEGSTLFFLRFFGVVVDTLGFRDLHGYEIFSMMRSLDESCEMMFSL